jgi:hypothetical protein
MSGSDLSSKWPPNRPFDGPDLNVNVDMAKLLNDAFVMVGEIAGGAQHNPLLNDEPIILYHPNVGGHVE